MGIEYFHVDVFSHAAYSGNSLPVFPDATGLTGDQMLALTRELRHFEAIFLEPTADEHRARARVFDLVEELPFAGHPVLGAAAVLHHLSGNYQAKNQAQTWQLELPSKTVNVVTEQTAHGYSGLLDQGKPEFLGVVRQREPFARAFGLAPEQLVAELPLEVVSTGLRYLILPVRTGVLEHARIGKDISGLLREVGAQFAVLFDVAAFEVRHWSNDGLLEDSATGSAAGAVGGYCLQHELVGRGEGFILRQGRFAGRPSILQVQPEGVEHGVETVKVGGDVVFVGRGIIDVLP